MTLAPHDAVVFDLDGTLIDTETIYRAAFMAAAVAQGVVVPAPLYASLVGIATPARAAALRRAFGAGFGVDAFLATYYAERAAWLRAGVPVCAGAAALLRRLEAPKAVATSASRRTALANLERAALATHFAHVVSRDDVPRGKPAPDSFLRAADLLGVAPEACVAVEDSAPGVAAAHAAGMRVVMVARRAPAATRRRCIAVVDDLFAAARLLCPHPAHAGTIGDGRSLTRAAVTEGTGVAGGACGS